MFKTDYTGLVRNKTFCRRQFFRQSLLAGTLLVPGGLFALRGFPIKLTFKIAFPAGKTIADYNREMSLWIDQARFTTGIEKMMADGSIRAKVPVALKPDENLVYSYIFADIRSLNRFRDLVTDCSFDKASREALGYKSDTSISLG
jgi:hypothetical protein